MMQGECSLALMAGKVLSEEAEGEDAFVGHEVAACVVEHFHLEA